MGFWDFIAPDPEGFYDTLRPVTPAVVVVGPVVLSQQDFLTLVYLNPGSGAGLAARLYYEASRLGVGRAPADVLASAVNDQGTAGGFGDGGGFGGSFGWKSEEVGMVLVIPNVYRVSIEAQSGGRPVTNVVGVRGSGSGLALQAAQAVQTAWKVASGPLSRLGAHYTLIGFRALDLSSPNGAIADVADSSGGGQGAGAKSTNAASMLVKWNGGTRSRSSRGRLYFGPLLEADIQADGRTVEAGALGAAVSAFSAFRSSLSASGFTLCVISPSTSQAFDVASSAVEPIIATQRRRIRG